LFIFFKAKIVSENFFGGFDDKDEADKKRGRKEWIDEMIMKSKQIKVKFHFYNTKNNVLGINIVFLKSSMRSKKSVTKRWILPKSWTKSGGRLCH
jgi:hypothetical protein